MADRDLENQMLYHGDISVSKSLKTAKRFS